MPPDPDVGKTPALADGSEQKVAPSLLEGRYQHLGFLSIDDFGAVGDGVADDTSAVQAAFTAAVTHRIELRSRPGRKYKLTQTIVVGAAGTLVTFSFDGSNCGYDADYNAGGLRGCVFESTMSDRPAFIFQTLRFGRMANCTIHGRLSYVGRPSFRSTDYTAGFRADRYSPHAGIAIDALSPHGSTRGAPPGGGYPGAVYSHVAGGSFKIVLDSVRIVGFVVGVVIQPSGFDGNGSSVSMSHGEIDQCCYGWSVGGSQNRNNVITDTSITRVMEAVTTTSHGARQGSPPKVFGGEWGLAARLFNIGSNIDILCCEGLYCESTRSIGIIGAGHFGAPHSASFVGCNLVLEGVTPDYKVPCILDHTMPVHFSGCTITTLDSVVGIVSRDVVAQFTSCQFYCTAGDGWFWIPNLDMALVPELKGCIVHSRGPLGSFGADVQAGVNTESYVSSANLKACKSFRYLPTARRIRTEQNTFDLFPPRDVVGYTATNVTRRSYVAAQTTGSYHFADTVVTFSAVHGQDFAKYDVLYWPMLAVSAASATELPALRVTQIAGDLVSCDRLFDLEEYDRSYLGCSIKIAPRFWALNPMVNPPWGTWIKGSSTVTFALDPHSYLSVGDFVFNQESNLAVGIHRITALTATAVVLSAPAGNSSFGCGALPTFAEMRRDGARFHCVFTSRDVFDGRYIFCAHGLQGHVVSLQVFDERGGVVTPTAVTSHIGSGRCAVDLGATPRMVSGTWTVIGTVLEAEL